MNDQYMPYEYRGNAENLLKFLSFVDKRVGDMPVAEIPFADLAHEWSEESGIGLEVDTTKDEKGRTITQIIEEGFDLEEFIGEQSVKPSNGFYSSPLNGLYPG